MRPFLAFLGDDGSQRILPLTRFLRVKIFLERLINHDQVRCKVGVGEGISCASFALLERPKAYSPTITLS